MATDARGLVTLTGILNSVLTYLPNIFVAILIVLAGAFVANLVARLVRGVRPPPR
jgi:hypothetical protein